MSHYDRDFHCPLCSEYLFSSMDAEPRKIDLVARCEHCFGELNKLKDWSTTEQIECPDCGHNEMGVVERGSFEAIKDQIAMVNRKYYTCTKCRYSLSGDRLHGYWIGYKKALEKTKGEQNETGNKK